MEKIAITCPKCGFSKEFPAESVPKGPFRINCPKCKETSVIRPAGTGPSTGSSPVQQSQKAPAPVPPAPEPPEPAPKTPEPVPVEPAAPEAPSQPEPEPPVESPAASTVQPEVSDMVEILCPGCGFRKKVKAGLVPDGAAITCPQCKERFFFGGSRSGEAQPDKPEGTRAKESATPVSERPRQSFTPNRPPVSKPLDTPATAPAKTGTGGGLPGIGELFARSWDIYKERVLTLLGLYLAAIVSFVVSLGVFAGGGYLVSSLAPAAGVPLLLAGGLAGITVGLIISTWFFAALLIAVVDENIGFMDAVTAGKAKILPFIWLFTIMTLIVMGGYVLLIIPGIILSVSFFFSQYIIAEDDTRGFDALLRSREYVKGYWWGIFLRAIVVWFVSGIIGLIPLIGSILSLAFAPFLFIYLNMNYRALKEIKGDITPDKAAGGRKLMVALATLGSVVLVLLFAYAMNELSNSAGSMDELLQLLKSGANMPTR